MTMKSWGPLNSSEDLTIWVVMGLQEYFKDIGDHALKRILFQYHPTYVGPSMQLVILDQGL
jgi:hypothetical protein